MYVCMYVCMYCIYAGMLLLGSTGKVIRSVNGNPGVATVAMVTLSKLVVPLKVLNIDDRELKLMEEIILFNPGGWSLVFSATDKYSVAVDIDKDWCGWVWLHSVLFFMRTISATTLNVTTHTHVTYRRVT